MKLKHFSGYGCITAKKISSTKQDQVTMINGEIYDGYKALVIEVRGNHERGLVREDRYDLYNWLVKRFDKSVKDYKDIIEYQYNDREETTSNGLDEEVCTYTFQLKINK